MALLNELKIGSTIAMTRIDPMTMIHSVGAGSLSKGHHRCHHFHLMWSNQVHDDGTCHETVAALGKMSPVSAS